MSLISGTRSSDVAIKKICKFLLVAFVIATTSTAMAASAPWYRWQHQVDGKPIGIPVCAQTMHGTWMQVSGPYKDANCETPGLPD